MANATEATNSREWSSIMFRISTGLPLARAQWVASVCQSSFGSAASNRMNDERGRLWGSGVIRPWRERIRQIVETAGTGVTWRFRW